jgi:uncharacterized protein involved in exopolysaccharide biosynthesis
VSRAAPAAYAGSSDLTLQNTQSRADKAVQQKLNALADALLDLMGELGDEHPELRRHRRELADAVGLEQREGSD